MGSGRKRSDSSRMCSFPRRERVVAPYTISQDAGWYHVGEPGGGEFRGYTYLYSDFLPLFDPVQVTALMHDNPRLAFGS